MGDRDGRRVREGDRQEGPIEQRRTRTTQAARDEEPAADGVDEIAQAGDPGAAAVAGEEYDPQIAAEREQAHEGPGGQGAGPDQRHQGRADAKTDRAGDQNRAGPEHDVVAQNRRPAEAPGEVERRGHGHQGADIRDRDGPHGEDHREQPIIARAEFAHQQDVEHEVEQALDQFA